MAGNYGFIPRNNPFDFELVSLLEILQAAKDTGALEEETDIFEKEALVASLDFPTTNLRWFAKDSPEEDLRFSLGAALLDDDGRAEISGILEAIEDYEADEEDLALWEDEATAMVQEREEILKAAGPILQHNLGGSDTIIQEDEQILADGAGLTPGKRFLTELRLARKKQFLAF